MHINYFLVKTNPINVSSNIYLWPDLRSDALRQVFATNLQSTKEQA